jgi:hypothetical protein
MDKASVRLIFSAMPLLGERRWRQHHQLTIAFPFDAAPKLILERSGITALYGMGIEHGEERRRGIVFYPNAIELLEVDKREISVLASDEHILYAT